MVHCCSLYINDISTDTDPDMRLSQMTVFVIVNVEIQRTN